MSGSERSPGADDGPFAILDTEGRPLGARPEDTGDLASVVALYRGMLLTRRFDAKAVALQRTGRLGTYASSLGQEATSVGIGAAMNADDILVPSYRETGAMLWRGVRPVELLLYWGGDERGSDFQGPRQDFPISIPVGSHALHAAGAAYALKLRRKDAAAVCVLGDGATSKGDFYEAINLAGVWRAPAVFVVTNNQWAISVPRARQTAARTLADKAVAAGIPGRRVDGNDVLAVRQVVGEALATARGGGGATLIEAETYRLTDHTTADDAARYRPAEEVSQHWHREPLARLRAFLVARHGWDKTREEDLLAAVDAEVEAAVAAYEATPPQPPESMFDHLYAALPAPLAEQRAAFLAALQETAHG